MLMGGFFNSTMKVIQNIVILCYFICAINGHFDIDNNNDHHPLEWNRKYTKPEGRYTRNVDEYEIVVPQKVNEDSSFLSYILPHYHEKRYQQSSSEKYEGHPAKKRDNKKHGVHYRVKLGGKDHHLELFPNWNFITPNLVLEVRGKRENGNASRIKIRQIADEHNCHYNGVVRGHSDSFAALSLCDGLVGYIKTNENKYFIEPLKGEEPMASGKHLHLIYKRGRGPAGLETGTCGTSGDWEKAWKERLTRQALLHMESQNSSSSFKRSISVHNFIETLVVADRKFLEYHNGTNVERYILTIMNMVSGYFHDASIGNQIDISIVRIMFLETEKEEVVQNFFNSLHHYVIMTHLTIKHPNYASDYCNAGAVLDLDITQDSGKTLESFCNWQVGVNPKVDHPNHHDIATLFTRHDLCESGHLEGECGLLGLAYVASVCDPERACSINEDSGLMLGVTVTHEIGHLMGCSHDAPQESTCRPESENGFYNVMSPIVYMSVNKWSKCSRKFVSALFENGLGDCLANEPADHKFEMNDEMLPGMVYDADMQCCWRHGLNSKVCMIGENRFCEKLFCLVDNACYSYGQPPADGTPCGSKKWCFERKCVEMGSRPDAVNGGWGAWGPESECSRTCGGGVSFSERECDNPKPNIKGRYCLGQRKRYEICNTKKCPPNKPTFRELQCTEKDSIEFKGVFHTWKPYIIQGGNPCELVCLHEGNKFMKLEPRIKDGTPCKPGTRNMCIAGVCRKIGCDWALDSHAENDVCGVCNGDGTHCKMVEETFTQPEGNGYVEVSTIPALSTNIIIEELAPSENTLAISSRDSKTFYLNGGNVEQRDGDYDFGKNTIGIYSHIQPEKEMVVIQGPTTEDLILHFVFYGSANPGVRYKYYVPIEGAGRIPSYHWEFVQWEPCSVECGGGTRVSEPKCIEEESGEVSDSFCNRTPKPETKQEPCNVNPCTARWTAGSWTKCTGCGGKHGFQSREIQCMTRVGNGEEETITDNKLCKGKPPSSKQPCVSTEPCRRERNEESSEERQHEIVEDPMPKENHIRIPILQKSQTHISDEAYEEMGDQVPVEIDQDNAEVTRGEDVTNGERKTAPTGRHTHG